MRELKIDLIKYDEESKLPTKSTEVSAGYDLYGNNKEIVTIEPGETKVVGTGIGMHIPDGYIGNIYPQKNLAIELGLRQAYCVGVMDSGYTDEIRIALFNDSSRRRAIAPYEKIAQIIVSPYQNVRFEVKSAG